MLGSNLRWLKSKPAGALRLAFRLPIYLYRLNLGWTLGHRFLLFVHLGRKSGLLRETVLKVILYDPATLESVVLSAPETQSPHPYPQLCAARCACQGAAGRRPRARVCCLRLSSFGGSSRCRLTTAQTCNLLRARSR